MSELAVVVEELRFAYQAERPILRGLNFAIPAGQCLVLAGLSGCGKTTLCHLLCGIIPNAIPGLQSGAIRLFGEDIAGQTLAQLAARVGMVFQNPDQQMVCTTVEDELAFGPENFCWPVAEIDQAVERMLQRLHLEHLRLRNPGTLSGGEKKLVAMAAVLMLRPRLLILDEPLSHLDPAGRQLVQQAIADLRTQGVTMLVVEHDLQLARFADRWLVLAAGEIVLDDSPAALLAEPHLLQAQGLWLDEGKL